MLPYKVLVDMPSGCKVAGRRNDREKHSETLSEAFAGDFVKFAGLIPSAL